MSEMLTLDRFEEASEIVKKVKEEELLETLRQELLHWNE
jgi:hypothetical protein